MESITRRAGLKKKKSVQNRLNKQYLAEQSRKLEGSIESYINSGELRKPPQLFQAYNVKCIQEIWEKFTQIEKLQLLSQIRIKAVGCGEIICTFSPKKETKQVFILLKGTLQYRINIDSNRRTIEYICRPGQVLYQPCLDMRLQFKPFSIAATSDCYLLKFPYDSLLRQNLCEAKQRKICQLLRTLENYYELSNEQIQFPKLIPYFSDCFNRKNQIILSETQSGYFCYISQGEIEIVKQSQKIKAISLISLSAGQIYIHNPTHAQNEKNYIKCKSQASLVYMIPNFLIHLLGSPEFEACIEWKNSISKSLHSKLFTKNQKILIDPLKFIKEKNRKKVKNWRKAKSQTRNSVQSWDLIGHFASQMKRSPSVTPLRSRQKQYAKSAHITKRSHFQTVSSLQNLKRMAQQQIHPEIYQCQMLKLTNSFKPRLKNSLQKQPTLLRAIPRILSTTQKKESRNKLVKKTKYKLLRYAQGHNLYGLDDYL